MPTRSAETRTAELDPFNDLKRRVEITRDARFQSNLRLDRQQKTSHFAISVLSLFVILLSLLPNIFDLNQAQSQALLALTIVNSVFVIITTFMDASGNYVHKGEQLHRSARNVASVFNKLMLMTPEERTDTDKIRDLQKEYQESLDDCPFNHDNIDYDLIKITKPYLFKDRVYTGYGKTLFRFFLRLRYKFLEYVWIMPHLLVVFLSIYIVYDIVIGGGIFGERPNLPSSN